MLKLLHVVHILAVIGLAGVPPLAANDGEGSAETSGDISAPSPFGEDVRLAYRATWGTFILFSNDVLVNKADDRYAIEMTGGTKGIAALFSPGRVAVSSEGDWTEEGPLPKLYVNSGKWDGKKYRRTMFYDAVGQFIGRTEDWPKKWKSKYQREPVPEQLQGGADPMSLLMHMMRPQDYAATATTPLTFQAFDGRRVVEYSVQCSADLDTLKKSRFSIFAGRARACKIGFQTVAGKLIVTEELRKEWEKERKKDEKRARRLKKKKKGKDDDDVEPDDNRFKLWVADPDGSGLVVPVRAAFKSGAGTVRVYLKDYSRARREEPFIARRIDPSHCKAPVDLDPSVLGDKSTYC